jgi:hypothetical protein
VSDVIATARRVERLVESALAPLLMTMAAWRPEFRAIVLEALAHRAAALAAEQRKPERAA